MLRDTLAVLAAFTLVSLLGCGGGDTAAPKTDAPKPDAPKMEGKTDAAPAPKKASGAAAYDKSKGTASIKGKVLLDGTAPARPKFDLAADAKCAAMHPDAITREDVISKDGGVQNAIVYIKSGAEKFTFDPPTEGVVIDQKGCQYSPHVLALMSGQPFLIRNSDELAHNIHGMSPTQGFNESTPNKTKEGAEIKKKFGEAEFMRIQCDIHKWMGAWAGVFDHPFFAVTKEDGSYEITGLPPGDYEIAVWHESAQGTDNDKLNAAKSEKVTLADKDAKTQDFKLKVKE